LYRAGVRRLKVGCAFNPHRGAADQTAERSDEYGRSAVFRFRKRTVISEFTSFLHAKTLANRPTPYEEKQ
jgi:hypothetical protein